MAPARGKRFAFLIAAVGLVVLLAAGARASHRLWENWHLSRLESEDWDELVASASWLIENGSTSSQEQGLRVLLEALFISGQRDRATSQLAGASSP